MMTKWGLLEEIEKIKKENLLIVVEGKKDKSALEQIGLKNIFVLDENGKSLLIKIEEISQRDKECIILTDFDKKGKEIYKLVKSELLQKGITLNNKLRNLLLKSHLSHIEGIFTFLKNYPK